MYHCQSSQVTFSGRPSNAAIARHLSTKAPTTSDTMPSISRAEFRAFIAALARRGPVWDAIYGEAQGVPVPEGEDIWRSYGATRDSAEWYMNKYLERLDGARSEEPGASDAGDRSPATLGAAFLRRMGAGNTAFSDVYYMRKIVTYVLDKVDRSEPRVSRGVTAATLTCAAGAVGASLSSAGIAASLLTVGAAMGALCMGAPLVWHRIRRRKLVALETTLRGLAEALKTDNGEEVWRMRNVIKEGYSVASYLEWTLFYSWDRARRLTQDKFT